MFHKKTVFIVGAGASQEASLPIGSDLAKKISHLLSIPRDWALIGEEHRTFANALRAFCEETNDFSEHLASADLIVRALKAADSIDSVIETFGPDRRMLQIAKAAIAYTILDAEARSDFFDVGISPRALDPVRCLKSTWYPAFAELIAARIPLVGIDSLFENLIIICFNYDRCIEEFLAHWLSVRYAIELSQSRHIVSRLPILRPHGQIASLVEVAYGDTRRLSDVFAIGSGIRTFAEQDRDQDAAARISNAMTEAEAIIFLGFGFHEANMEILKPHRPGQARHILATGRKIKPPNAAAIEQELRQLFGPRESPRTLPVKVDYNSGCRTLFDKFSRAMNSAS